MSICERKNTQDQKIKRIPMEHQGAKVSHKELRETYGAKVRLESIRPEIHIWPKIAPKSH